MERKIIKTADNSTTIYLPEWNEHYHSKHGAVQEAMHVFIKNGLFLFKNKNISILEIGFGTGLNAFVSLIEAKKHNIKIEYTGIDAYPISSDEAKHLNYISTLNAEEFSDIFKKIHLSAWEKKQKLTEEFHITKRQQKFQNIDDENTYHLIYFDAFGARVQPELWTEVIFKKMYKALKYGGVLVTYSAKGSVKRAMISVGFQVEKLSGPPGKREMLRATKTKYNEQI